jgi:transcriptional regulator with XRE-family HTH domain
VPGSGHAQNGGSGSANKEQCMEQNNDKTPYINVDYFQDLTGELSETDQEGLQGIGARIRHIREDKDVSLDELSRQTGFEVDFLSRIEKGQVQPQLGTVLRLSKALDSAFGRLLSGAGDKPYSITRRHERKTVSRSTSPKGQKKLYSYSSLAPEVSGRHMEPLMVRLEENPDEETSIHDGEEFIFVLEGRVRLKIGEERFQLEPGDSAYYLSSKPHLVAAEESTAIILAVLFEG